MVFSKNLRPTASAGLPTCLLRCRGECALLALRILGLWLPHLGHRPIPEVAHALPVGAGQGSEEPGDASDLQGLGLLPLVFRAARAKRPN